MQVVLSLNPGGTERLVIEIVKTLRRRVTSTVCCLDEAGAWAAELEAVGTQVVSLARRPGFQPRLGCKIARLAEAGGVDVLHCHHYSPFVYGQIAALANRRLRVVFTEHGRLSDNPPSLKRRLINPILGRLPSSIVAVSADLKRHMIAEGLPAARVSVIHNGIDPGPRPTPAERLKVRHEFGFLDDQLVLGTVGRLDPVKDLRTLLEAVGALHKARPTVRLLIVGDGPERPRLESYARHLGIERIVAFAGYRRDARALLPALDVYVNSSVHEGVSLTLLEAMAAALSVVATSVGGTPEVIADQQTGLLVEARSAGQLASAIQSLLHVPEWRFALGNAARARVETDFSIDTMVDKYLRAYRHAKES
jgi:glycosyltransferase involved in cell wall biosynthesis